MPNLRRFNAAFWIPAILLLTLMASALFAGVIGPHDPEAQRLLDRFKPPSFAFGGDAYPLGTDHLGRDLLTRMLFGLRVSLLVGFLAVLLSVAIGYPLGLIAGYAGGRTEAILMRLVDIQLSVPTILVALAALAILGAGLTNVIIVIGLVGWAGYARLARGAVLAERNKEYVTAAGALGAGAGGLIWRHLLPNTLSIVMVQVSVHMPRVIILEATLSFLGLGVSSSTASLGMMVSQGYEFLYSGVWWASILPGVALMLLILSVNLLSDWLRDFLDPRGTAFR
ncbi:MAG: ABC transporter permease [Trueperaceae bacterium]|nr:ABC transporter permease [Trueperaceae bacterium]